MDDDILLIKQTVKFAITGGSGLIANLLFLSFLVEVTHIPEEYAAIVSTATVLLGSFLLTDYWVFDEVGIDGSTIMERGIGYFAVMTGGKLVNYGLYLVFLKFEAPYQVAWFIGSVLVFVLTFFGNRVLWQRQF